MLELFGVLFITLFIAFLLMLVVLNLDIMFKKGNVEKIETVNPALLELIEMGKGFGSTKLSGSTKEETKQNLKTLFTKQRSYLETLPKHKTRIKLRNKRKGKK